MTTGAVMRETSRWRAIATQSAQHPFLVTFIHSHEGHAICGAGDPPCAATGLHSCVGTAAEAVCCHWCRICWIGGGLALAGGVEDECRAVMRLASPGAHSPCCHCTAQDACRVSCPSTPVHVHVFDGAGIGAGGSGAAAGLLHPLNKNGKLLWRGEESVGEALQLLGVAEEAARQEGGCAAGWLAAWRRRRHMGRDIPSGRGGGGALREAGGSQVPAAAMTTPADVPPPMMLQAWRCR